MAPLRRVDLLRVFARSLCLQASWSFRGMQSLGFAYAMEPALRRLHGGPGEEYRRALGRHLEFFNTHPFLAAAVLGGAVRLEAEAGDGVGERVRRLKNALMGPYGAIGDSLYWGGLKPLLVVAALLLAAGGVPWAPIAFVLAFAALNLGGRAYAFALGYRQGPGVVAALGRLDLLGWARRAKAGAALLLGALVATAPSRSTFEGWGVPEPLWVGGALALCLATAWAAGRGVKTWWMVILSTLFSWGIVAWT